MDFILLTVIVGQPV